MPQDRSSFYAVLPRPSSRLALARKRRQCGATKSRPVSSWRYSHPARYRHHRVSAWRHERGDGASFAALSGMRGVGTANSVVPHARPELVLQLGHSEWIRSVVFTTDGRRLVSAAWDHTVKIWARETPEG